MKLYCVRHGEAIEGPIDEQRSLSKQGREDVERMTNFLHKNNVQVAHILHSKRLRAKQTAEIIAASLSPEKVVESVGLDTLDCVLSMRDMVQAWEEDTLLVGHMPFIPKLIACLTLANEDLDFLNFPPGTVACLEKIAGHDWVVNWLLPPGVCV